MQLAVALNSNPKRRHVVSKFLHRQPSRKVFSGPPGIQSLSVHDDGLVAAESNRIRAEYLRRAQELSPELYSPWQPSEVLSWGSRTRAAAMMLHDAEVFPGRGDQVLEVGFGTLGWLGTLMSWRLKETDLHGIEVDARRATKAHEALPAADLRIGDATKMPWETGSFQLVIASTVFTSVLDARVRQLIANEITRVMAPGGALLWYDFAVNNPRNLHVRKVDRKELRELFPQLSGEIKSITLAPPIARFVAPRSWVLATMLEAIPFLRTHLIAVLIMQ